MNKTRKAFAVILVCVVTLFATACGKDNTPFSHGTWNGKTYTSEFFGIRLQLGSEWVVISDNDLAKRMRIKDMSESSIQSVFDKGGNVYEMITARADGSSISIVIQDHNKTLALSEEEFFSAGLPFVKTMLEAQGYKCSVEKDTVYFLGKNTFCISLSLTANNVTVHEIMIPVFKSHYTALISFGSGSKPDLYLLIDMVSAI